MLLGYLLALVTAAAWAHNSIVYTFSGIRVGSNTTAHIRLWIALPVSWLIQLLITGNLIPQSHTTLSLLATAISGILGYFIADLFIFRAFVLIGPRNTMVILTTTPLFSAILSFFVYGEVLSIVDIGSGALILAGIVIVIRERQEDFVPSNGDAEKTRGNKKSVGIIAGFIGSLSQSFGIILAKYSLEAGDHPVEINLLRIISGLIAMVLYLLVRRQFIKDFVKMKDLRALFLIAFGAVIGPSLGVVAALYAILFIPVGVTTLLMQTTPIMLLPFDKIFFGRKITSRTIIGTAVSVVGITVLLLL